MLPSPTEEQQARYRRAFARNCMVLIVRAHGTLDTVSLRKAEEPDITGELVRKTRDLLESAGAEPWMEDLEILDDPPQDLPGRYGKRRPRIDIEFVQIERGRRPRFHIEAKRLYRSDSASEYFGAEGLQMFVSGHYASGWPSAGMLGYVQTDNCTDWLAKLAIGFANRRTELRVCGDRLNLAVG